MFRRMAVPLELMVRHGALFKAQAKRAIKKVYSEGWEYRRNINSVNNPGFKMVPTVKFSHALVVSGHLGKIPCEHLVIDTGSSISMINIQTARKGPIPLN